MQFGMFTVADNYIRQIDRSAEQFIDEMIEQSEAADQLGFDAVWFAEHHFDEYGILTTPQVLLSAVAQRTQSVRLGVAVVTLPFHNPIRVAEDYALLDVLSGGRVNLGLGSAYLPHEFAGFNVNPEEKVHIFNEALELIEKAWRGEKFSHKGKYFQFNDVQLLLLPKQKKVPLWIGSLSERGAYYVGKMGYNLMGVAYVASFSIEEMGKVINTYKTAYLEAGHDESQINIPIALHTYVAPTREEAINDSREHLNLYLDTRLYGRSAKFEDLEAREQLLIGSPEDVIQRLKKYEAIGCNHVMMLMNFGGLPHEKVLKSMELVAKEVIPAFRKTPKVSTV